MFRKGQFKLWIEAVGGGTEVSFVNPAAFDHRLLPIG
jgi:hypothetical protein